MHSVRRDGLVLAALLIAQFFISPEVFVMSLLFAAVGLLAPSSWAGARSWRGQATPSPALGLAAGLAVVVLAYPAWFGLAGPQAVTGVLFVVGAVDRRPPLGPRVPGELRRLRGTTTCASAATWVATGRLRTMSAAVSPLAAVASVVLGRRRPLTWLLVLLVVVSVWLSLGARLIGGPAWLSHLWLPWTHLSTLPVLKEILPDQFAPFIALFAAFLIAIGVDAFLVHASARRLLAGAAPAAVGAGVTAAGRSGRARAGVRHLQPAVPRCRRW